MIGGILLGITEIFAKAYISSQMADAIVFAVLMRSAAREADRTSRKEDSGESVGGRNGKKIKQDSEKRMR